MRREICLRRRTCVSHSASHCGYEPALGEEGESCLHRLGGGRGGVVTPHTRAPCVTQMEMPIELFFFCSCDMNYEPALGEEGESMSSQARWDTPPFPYMSHPVSRICQKLILFFRFFYLEVGGGGV